MIFKIFLGRFTDAKAALKWLKSSEAEVESEFQTLVGNKLNIFTRTFIAAGSSHGQTLNAARASLHKIIKLISPKTGQNIK